MGVVINVFYTGQPSEGRFISFLVKNDFVHYVDSARHKDHVWVNQNCRKGLFRCVYDKVPLHLENATEISYEEKGVFYVLIVDCVGENPDFYFEVEKFLIACLEDNEKESCYYKPILDMHQPREEEVIEKKKEKRTIEDTQDEDFGTGYTFAFQKIEEFDCIFYQITKPNTDRPYVVLVEDFSKHGHKRLFSSMRLFNSWGVSKHDGAFLVKLWEYLGNTVEVDFNDLIEEHVNAVLYGEEEPKVWRNNLSSVIENYKQKRNKKTL